MIEETTPAWAQRDSLQQGNDSTLWADLKSRMPAVSRVSATSWDVAEAQDVATDRGVAENR